MDSSYVTALTATRLVYFIKKSFNHIKNIKLYLDVQCGIPYLAYCMMSVFPHITIVALDCIDIIRKIERNIDNVKTKELELLHLINYRDIDVLDGSSNSHIRFHYDIKQFQVITCLSNDLQQYETIIKHHLPESCCKIICFRVGPKAFPDLYNKWLMEMKFELVKRIKGCSVKAVDSEVFIVC